MSDIENQEQDIDQEDEPESKDPSSVKVVPKYDLNLPIPSYWKYFYFIPTRNGLPANGQNIRFKRIFSKACGCFFHSR